MSRMMYGAWRSEKNYFFFSGFSCFSPPFAPSSPSSPSTSFLPFLMTSGSAGAVATAASTGFSSSARSVTTCERTVCGSVSSLSFAALHLHTRRLAKGVHGNFHPHANVHRDAEQVHMQQVAGDGIHLPVLHDRGV